MGLRPLSAAPSRGECWQMAEPAPGKGRPAASGTPPRELIDELAGAAVAAPSLHNTQPWRLRVRRGGPVIELLADPARMLAADPGGRAAHVARGAALFNLRLAGVPGQDADAGAFGRELPGADLVPGSRMMPRSVSPENPACTISATLPLRRIDV